MSDPIIVARHPRRPKYHARRFCFSVFKFYEPSYNSWKCQWKLLCPTPDGIRCVWTVWWARDVHAQPTELSAAVPATTATATATTTATAAATAFVWLSRWTREAILARVVNRVLLFFAHFESRISLFFCETREILSLIMYHARNK